jgi:hypothetical protein
MDGASAPVSTWNRRCTKIHGAIALVKANGLGASDAQLSRFQRSSSTSVSFTAPSSPDAQFRETEASDNGSHPADLPNLLERRPAVST